MCYRFCTSPGQQYPQQQQQLPALNPKNSMSNPSYGASATATASASAHDLHGYTEEDYAAWYEEGWYQDEDGEWYQDPEYAASSYNDYDYSYSASTTSRRRRRRSSTGGTGARRRSHSRSPYKQKSGYVVQDKNRWVPDSTEFFRLFPLFT